MKRGSRYWQNLVDQVALMVYVRARELAGEDPAKLPGACPPAQEIETSVQIVAKRQFALEPIPLPVKDHRRHDGLRPTTARPERVRDCIEAASGMARELFDRSE